MNVDASVLTVMDFIVADDGVAVGSNLNTGQGVAVDVVVLDETAPLAEDVDAALVAVVDLVASDGRIRIRSDPDAREIVRVDAVLDELALTRFVHVNSTRLTVVDLAPNHRRIRTGCIVKSSKENCYCIISMDYWIN